jgi:DNA polymerase III subunit gamma/tau
MSYQVIARKWRPQRFAEVHGQEHISLTLQQAIKRERVGHAYLFVGPRGIGKTTTARIFAKALNCSSPVADAEGLPEPCCACQTCLEITAGNCLDVLEIDGASNNSVDNIRDLRETVQYAPTNGRRYKIYIIDEVHMLTTQAWNALLKTLEEPPAHVKFLFATTEAHKVLPTVMSRCQRFDLKRISVPVIIRSLKTIAEQEQILVDEAALGVIARAAEGGMRDAQSIFDQIIAFCGGTTEAMRISEEDVIEVFGLASGAELRQLAGTLLQNDASTLIETLHGLADRGRNLERLAGDLLQVLRNLMIYQIIKNPEKVLELTSTEQAEYQELVKLANGEVLQRLVEGMLEFEPRLRSALNKRVQLEAGLLRVARDAHSVTLDDLLTRLRTLHEQGALPALPAEANPGPKGPEPVVAPAMAPPARPAAVAPSGPGAKGGAPHCAAASGQCASVGTGEVTRRVTATDGSA